jgi:coenzyme F420 hydrogenase subunit delta
MAYSVSFSAKTILHFLLSTVILVSNFTRGTVCTMKPEKYKVMIFGCGNIIMGDDGYGPAVVDELNARYKLPDDIQAVDAGTCVREYLFDYLLTEEGRPEKIIILDAVDFPDRKPGEVFQILPDEIPAKKIHDFSLHQFPTVNLLQELEQNTGVNVLILAAQIEHIPDEIAPGLSSSMSNAVNEACEKLSQILSIKAQ